MYYSDMNVFVRFFLLILGSLIFFWAVGAFIVRLLCAAFGIYLVWLGLRPYTLYRFRRW